MQRVRERFGRRVVCRGLPQRPMGIKPEELLTAIHVLVVGENKGIERG
ncbi:MAG: hypothetical protein Q9O74_03675 [Planctomycetota bacterium]|nr:hypothetical protein [Planctomycetota bacterium]